MFMKYLMLIIIWLTPNWASAFFWEQNIAKVYIQGVSIHVNLIDGATGACWTNLKETKEYSEEKLRMSGITVADEKGSDAKAKIYTLNIVVNANRL